MEQGLRVTKESDKYRFESTANTRVFDVGNTIFSRNYFGRYCSKARVFLRKIGPVSNDVQVGSRVFHRNAFQLQIRLYNVDLIPVKKKAILLVNDTALTTP